MSIQLRSLVFVSFSLFALACGDDDSGSKVQGQCKSLVTSYCSRVVSCAQKDDLLEADFTADDLRDECQEYMLDDAHCEDAVRVSKSYGQCLSQAKTLDCDDVTDALTNSSDLSERYIEPLPTSCQGAVLYDE
jgi:hypothetical protein